MIDKFSEVATAIENQVTPVQVEASIQRYIGSKGRQKWYQVSYRPFLIFFAETRCAASVQDWVLRVSCVGAWLGIILKADVRPETIEPFRKLEEVYTEQNLWEIGSRSKDGETFFGGTEGLLGNSIKDFVGAGNALLNGNEKNDSNVASVSKLLHFAFPDLFPILDRNVAENLFGTPYNITYEKYRSYVFGLQEVLPRLQFLFELSKRYELPVLRLIDSVFFSTGGEEAGDGR